MSVWGGCIYVLTDSPVRPSRCWQDPLHLSTPPTNPVFSVYVYKWIYTCVCVSLPTGLIDSVWVWCSSDWQQNSHRAIESSCGKRGTFSLAAFSPEGESETNTEREGEGERGGERERGIRESKQSWGTNEWMTSCMFESYRSPFVGLRNTDKIKINWINSGLCNHPDYSLISWVGNHGDHRGLWETVHTLGVMSYVGDRPSSPGLIRWREDKYEPQDQKC